MCAHATGRIPARAYLNQAKRRAEHLQSLRSVSRAFRQQAVREIKVRAITKEKEDVYRQGTEAAARHPAQAPDPRGNGGAQGYLNDPGAYANNTIANNTITSVYLRHLEQAQQQASLSAAQIAYYNALRMQNAQPAPEPPLPKEVKAGELVAWRCWDVRLGTFYSMAVGTPWTPDAPMQGDPVKPSEGVHAWKTRKQAEDYAKLYPTCEVAIGSIELWGLVIEHEEGYRAQFGQIKDIVETRYPSPSAAAIASVQRLSTSHYVPATIAEPDIRRPSERFPLLPFVAAGLLCAAILQSGPLVGIVLGIGGAVAFVRAVARATV